VKLSQKDQNKTTKNLGFVTGVRVSRKSLRGKGQISTWLLGSLKEISRHRVRD
jgi:hypothetical protein